MRRVILTGFALVLLVSPVSADDALVREMELEITIRALSRTVYDDAETKAENAIKETTLWKRWRAALKPLQPKSQACRDARAERRGRRSMTAYMAKIQAACKEHFARSESPEHKKLRKVADALRKEVLDVLELFVERIYVREMEHRLAEMKVEVTKEVKQQLQRALKKHGA